MTCRGLHHHQKANLGPKPMLLVLEHIVLTSLLFYLSHPNSVSQQEDLGHRVLLRPSLPHKDPPLTQKSLMLESPYFILRWNINPCPHGRRLSALALSAFVRYQLTESKYNV